jgi:HAD superfamily hydrolase (TIGR01484 family)
MQPNKKIIVCDLDGTLAPSKSNLEKRMADVICRVLQKHKMAVVSGGSYHQFQKQFLTHLSCDGEILKNLYLFPTNGSSCFVYDEASQTWKNLYEENITASEKEEIFSAFKKVITESGVVVSNPYGELLEDRGGQVTFSGRGQEAPLDVKEIWDPDQAKRKKIVEILQKEIPQFEVRIGGATSIDETGKGITKANAIRKIEDILNVKKEDIVFLGDALFPGGNDSSAKETGVECVSVSGPEEAKKYLLEITRNE